MTIISLHFIFFSWNRCKKLLYEYDGTFPPLADFLSVEDNLKVINEKKKFWEEHQDQKWCFQTEIINYAKHCTKLLAKCCLAFLKQSFDLQERIKEIERNPSSLILHPFAKSINSRSSFTFNIHKLYYLNNYDLETIMFERTSNQKNVSLGEYQFCSYKAVKEPDSEWRHAFNHKDGQKKFGNYHVDLYSEKLNVVVQYNGCLYHAHEPCLDHCNKNRTSTSTNFMGKTFNQLKEQDEKFKKYMAENFPSVQVQTINGCEWKTMKREKQENGKSMWFNFKKEFSHLYWDQRPRRRLIPREAIRGGGLEVYNLKFDQKDSPNEDLYFCDINSLYSYVAINTKFGIGPCDTLITQKQIDNVYFNITDNQYYYNEDGQSYELQGGAAFCKVLVPANQEYPFLPYRINNEYSVMACCRTCAETKNTHLCNHKKSSRIFTGNWMISTLNQLRSEGYEIEFLEIHFFRQKAHILKDYVQLLCSERLKNSGLISPLMSTTRKQEICDEINTVMNLPDHLKLTPSQCVNNPGQKQFFKDFMNCLFGMFSRNTSDVKTKKCVSQNELNDIASKYEIVNVNVLSNSMCEVDYVLNSDTIPPNLDSNIYIGGEVSSQGFVELRKNFNAVIQHGGIPYMVDTDCLVFKLAKNTPNPLTIGSAVGLWKHEFDPGCIDRFYALASRNYALSFTDKNNALHNIIKVRGLCLKSCLNENVLNCDTYNDFISDYFQDNFTAITMSQVKKFKDKKTLQYNYKISDYNFCNILTTKRFLLTNKVDDTFRELLETKNCDILKSYPYGYKVD